MYYNLHDEELARVKPEQLQRYLEATGWENVNSIPGKFLIYHLPSNSSSEVLVPVEPEFRDYTRRVSEAVRDLADYQEIPVESVLNDILCFAMDHLIWHLDAPTIKEHRVRLEEGVQLYQASLALLKAAAHDETEPKLVHSRQSRPEATRFLDACQLGTPTPGSYVVNIFCPANLELTEQPSFDFPGMERNFARQITVRTLRSLYRCASAVDHDKVDTLVHPSNKDETVSANFFEALGDLDFHDKSTELTVSVNWTVAIAPPTDVPESVTLRSRHFQVFREIARRLRTVPNEITENLAVREIATLVRPYIQDKQIEDITLHVDEKRIVLQNGYWRIPIRPSREPRPLFPYYEALANLEEEIQDKEDIKITLASGDPLVEEIDQDSE